MVKRIFKSVKTNFILSIKKAKFVANEKYVSVLKLEIVFDIRVSETVI